MKFACPNCGQHLDGDVAYVGRTLNCPTCSTAFTVTASTAVAVARAAPPAAPPAAAVARTPLRSRTTPLAVWSLVLSVLSLVLGPLGSIPGIICGHLAKRAIRRNPSLQGSGLATAGVVLGYFFLLAFLATVVFFVYFTKQVIKAVEEAGGPAAFMEQQAGPNAPSHAAGPNTPPPGQTPIAEPWKIDPENATIPAEPAQGILRGRPFVVKSARFEGTDLVLVGDGELRLRGQAPTGGMVDFSLSGQLKQAATYSVSTLILSRGSLAQRYRVTFKSASEEVDLTPDAELRLSFRAPVDGVSHGAIHLGLGPRSREYVLGEFQATLSPEMAATLKNVKPAFKGLHNNHPSQPNP